MNYYEIAKKIADDFFDYEQTPLTHSCLIDAIAVALRSVVYANRRKPYEASDIEKPYQVGGEDCWVIKCGDFGWAQQGWVKTAGDVFKKATADALYAGLVSSGNVPEVMNNG